MTQPAVREIDTGEVRTRYARGWHCLGLAKDFRDGKPHAVEAFGTKLVVFADSKGDIKVLDSYCRHLGGDLSQGEIKGDEVACPFHDWRWGGDGKCKSIPYAKRVPMRAKTRTWETDIRNEQLFVWHDHEGGAPLPEERIPEIAERGEGVWSDWLWNSVLIEGSNCREIVDNIVDMAHFYYIHNAYPTAFKNVFEGHTASQYLNSKGRPDIYGERKYYSPDALLRSDATYFGPSYMINWLHNDYGPDVTIETVLINCHYPVSQNAFRLQWGVSVQLLPGMDEDQGRKITDSFSGMFGEGFLEDVAIWKNKTAIENPLLCEEDGPVYQLRRWYEQFYVDRAAVEAEMTQRFEFEVDVAHANEKWRAEVAENIRVRDERRRAEAEAGAVEADA